MNPSSRPPVRVLVVDDSPTIQKFLCWMVEQAGFVVAGTAGRVDEAEAIVHRRRPDLVLSDVRLEDGNGIELTERVLAKRGVPIILITAHDPTNPDLVFRAMQAGALDLLPKPPALTSPGFEAYRRSFEMTLRSLSGTPIVRRSRGGIAGSHGKGGGPSEAPATAPPVFPGLPIVAIAASTGGPLLVGDLLKALPIGGFLFAIVVQHIVPDFAESFRAWLSDFSGKHVQAAQDGLKPAPGCVYVSPANCHIQLHQDGTFRTLPSTALASPHVPSADVMFESLAVSRPRDVLAIQLSGMGSDGASGLSKLRSAGNFTVVQSPETAAVDGMPKSAIERGAASVILDPKEIASLLRSLAQASPRSSRG